MQDALLRALLAHRPTLRQRWETLLRARPATSPLANPDTLVHLMDWTLDCLFDELRGAPSRRRAPPRGAPPPCPCGLNPLIAYFQTVEAAAEQTFCNDIPDTHRFTGLEREAALDELKGAIKGVARREIDSFCAVCLHGHRTNAAMPASCARS